MITYSNMKTFRIENVNPIIRDAVVEKINNLNKPLHALGRLETLALQICMVQQKLSPTLHHPVHLLFGGDHGIEIEGVSKSPRQVTWQQMKNFANGGGGVNVFARQHGFDLKLVDVGVDHDLSDESRILNRKINPGTRNFLYDAAMTQKEFDRAIEVGRQLVWDAYNDGADIISIGEMGVGNTSPSSIWMSLMGHLGLHECVGAGSGLNAWETEHKLNVLTKAVERFQHNHPGADTETIIRYFGGYEMVAAIGAMLRAAELNILILVDGFIMTACMLAASQLYPAVLDRAIFSHCGDEAGHQRMLALMNAKPLLHLGLKLGEGTGALIAYPIVESAVRMINEMNNFDNAHITKYF